MASQPGQNTTFRIEQFPNGNSQNLELQPINMTDHWQFKFTRERTRCLEQEVLIDDLQQRLYRADAEVDNMKRRLCQQEIDHQTQLLRTMPQHAQESPAAPQKRSSQDPISTFKHPESSFYNESLRPINFIPPPSMSQASKPKRSSEVPSETGPLPKRQARQPSRGQTTWPLVVVPKSAQYHTNSSSIFPKTNLFRLPEETLPIDLFTIPNTILDSRQSVGDLRVSSDIPHSEDGLQNVRS